VGFTLIELIVVLAIVALLASIAAPRYFQSLERAREKSLRTSLAVMRDAIDQYAADKGRYPKALPDLATERYLREIPQDPYTGRPDTWVAISAPPGAALGDGVFDVRSGAAGRGLEGSLYADW
jgi:prepilin-type N-terminal cleavage/methylation domain-containing protein